MPRFASSPATAMKKSLLLRSSDGKVMVAPIWDKRPTAAQGVPMETGVHSRALQKVIHRWTKHGLAEASGESRDSLARWEAEYARCIEKDGLTKEVAAAVRELRLRGVIDGGERQGPEASGASSSASSPSPATGPTQTGMKKSLMLRSSDGKVMVAPIWDKRPTATQGVPMETEVHSRALQKVIHIWTKHGLANASGESQDSLARWDAEYARRLEKEGLTEEVAAAVRHLRLQGVNHGGRRPEASSATHPCAPRPSDMSAAAYADLAAAWYAARVDPTTALHAADADPGDACSGVYGDVDPPVWPDEAAASRALGRQQAEKEESACHHRKRPLALKASSNSHEEAARIQNRSFVPACKISAAKSANPCSYYIKEATGLSPYCADPNQILPCMLGGKCKTSAAKSQRSYIKEATGLSPYCADPNQKILPCVLGGECKISGAKSANPCSCYIKEEESACHHRKRSLALKASSTSREEGLRNLYASKPEDSSVCLEAACKTSAAKSQISYIKEATGLSP